MEGEFSAAFVTGASEEEGEVGEGWVGELLADVEFLINEALEVVMARKLD